MGTCMVLGGLPLLLVPVETQKLTKLKDNASDIKTTQINQDQE